ncbi:MAG TPA: hypothetical protein VIH73_05560 [Acidimicrobiales bacterium]
MIEVVKFRLNGDVGPEEFLERNADFQQHFIYQQDGVLRRTVASGLDGTWVAITWWRSMKDARRSQSAASASSVAAAFTSLLDPASVETDYFKELPG